MGNHNSTEENFADTTIRDARTYINTQLDKGKAAKCPACTQTVKVYPRKIYASMSRSLIDLYKLDKVSSDYYHISQIDASRTKAGGGDFAKLKYWGLVEEMKHDPSNTKKRTSGMWKITNMGKSFVENRMRVVEVIEIFNQRPIRARGGQVSIIDTLGKEFNYSELMST